MAAATTRGSSTTDVVSRVMNAKIPTRAEVDGVEKITIDGDRE